MRGGGGGDGDILCSDIVVGLCISLYMPGFSYRPENITHRNITHRNITHENITHRYITPKT